MRRSGRRGCNGRSARHDSRRDWLDVPPFATWRWPPRSEKRATSTACGRVLVLRAYERALVFGRLAAALDGTRADLTAHVNRRRGPTGQTRVNTMDPASTTQPADARRGARGDGYLTAGQPDDGRAAALTVGILADMLEEKWPSMDLVADSLVRELPRVPAHDIVPLLVRPRLVPVIRRIRRSADGAGSTADRVFNRFWLYRRALVGRVRRCGVFHVVDHSYAHLALALPQGRTIVTCHDTDTFRGFLIPGEIETALPRWLVRRVAAGLRRAALVVCPSQSTAEDVVACGLAGKSRVVVVPNGVETGAPDPAGESDAERLLGSAVPAVDLLHVGSTIPRKRLDLLLEVFAAIAAACPRARLVRVGGEFSADQQVLAARLGVASRILVLPFLARGTLQAVYRRAALLLLTSEREGFGLPVIEACAAGLPVVARDLPVLREVAGDTATFIGDTTPEAWARACLGLLAERQDDPGRWAARRDRSRSRATAFGWNRYAERMARLYARVAAGGLA